MKFHMVGIKGRKIWNELERNDEIHLYQCYLGLGHCLDITFSNNEYKLYSRDGNIVILSMVSENYMDIHDYLVKTYVDILEK